MLTTIKDINSELAKVDSRKSVLLNAFNNSSQKDASLPLDKGVALDIIKFLGRYEEMLKGISVEVPLLNQF